VLVIAADSTDTSPEDMFKIEKLTVRQVPSGVYENKATVTAQGATDTDLSHYKNPAAAALLAHIGDYVWEDTNANGVQNSGETGISGVTVKLMGVGADGLINTGDDVVVATTTTSTTGSYGFDVAAGTYAVQVVAPSGYTASPKDAAAATDATDSDVNAAGTTGGYTLKAGDINNTVDAGLYRKASVGDKVWDDMNHNNIQDASEPGIGSIRVKLIGAGADKVFGTADDTTANTTTDSNGNYKFSNLDPGSYKLEFDKANVMHYNASYGATYNMSDWKWAVKDTGSNDAIDSDVAGDAVEDQRHADRYLHPGLGPERPDARRRHHADRHRPRRQRHPDRQPRELGWHLRPVRQRQRGTVGLDLGRRGFPGGRQERQRHDRRHQRTVWRHGQGRGLRATGELRQQRRWRGRCRR
jgi:hypothetical protein